MMKDFPVTDFQVHQHADLRLTVRIVPRADWLPRHDDDLRRQLALIAPDLAVEIERVATIPRTVANKRRPVISELAPQRPPGGPA
jgi:hypothetical protein